MRDGERLWIPSVWQRKQETPRNSFVALGVECLTVTGTVGTCWTSISVRASELSKTHLVSPRKSFGHQGGAEPRGAWAGGKQGQGQTSLWRIKSDTQSVPRSAGVPSGMASVLKSQSSFSLLLR